MADSEDRETPAPDAAKPATIEDVARIAGVSIATVSRAVHAPDKVAESTRRKVHAAIARTGYTTNVMARNLRMKRSRMVLVLAPSIGDPNFPGILIGLEKAAAARDYAVLIGNTDGDSGLEETYLRFLSTGQADGLILLTGHLPVAGWGMSPARHFPPMVTVSRPLNDPGVPHVGVDDAAAARVATEYLLAQGHRQIAHVRGPEGDIQSERREAGFRAAIAAHHATAAADPWVLAGDGTSESGRAAVERLFIRDTLPTAFFCYNDDTAIGVMAALSARGHDVPGRFSVVGFDDIPFASNTSPALTTIRQPRRQIGERAMGLLLDRLEAPSAPQDATAVLMHGDLVIRDSALPPDSPSPGQKNA
ncbi:LacI family DNA-binding transcriptional regulator [Oceanomicrobium pacificus]|uniref:Substrate-binding domain-containing protein n=1 Tax=Oceanomicrobium pacificus TaxID=2692916 RepID=A0A6B0TSW8_9RHOB|nr:LacI family DNA-binding transcriptional regulator [Oceanomicrobium pacificus]MXU64093.1 substrate-binding domain-containing protein [Oceanomicrobium pacificus]